MIRKSFQFMFRNHWGKRFTVNCDDTTATHRRLLLQPHLNVNPAGGTAARCLTACRLWVETSGRSARVALCGGRMFPTCLRGFVLLTPTELHVRSLPLTKTLASELELLPWRCTVAAQGSHIVRKGHEHGTNFPTGANNRTNLNL